MNKYIVRNCPCLFNAYYASGKTVRFECNDGNHEDKLCCDVTDCLLKRIYERCELYEFNYPVNQAIQMLTQNIENMLEIEEVDD